MPSVVAPDRRCRGGFAALLTRWLTAAAFLLALGAPGLPALADEFSDRLNNQFKSIAPDRRSDIVLVPLLAKLTDPPAGLSDPYQAALLPGSSAAFAEAAAWAQAEPQKAFFAGLEKVTGEKDWKKAYAWGQPYGTEGVDPETIALRAYTDLGDPPLLARANHMYLPMLDRANVLVHIEATRRLAAGEAGSALELLWRWLHFSRSMADRLFFAEVEWSFKTMLLTLERMRDIAYVDSRADKQSLTADQTRDILKERMVDRGGIIGLDRLRFPIGNEVGCEQVVNRVFNRRGKANPAVFSPMLAESSSRTHPLRLFSETARWDSIADLHGNDLETREALKNVAEGWYRRWQLKQWDPALKLRSDFEKLDTVKFAVVRVLVGDLSSLFELRIRLRVELGGTRVALALNGFCIGQKGNFPRDITAVRPAFVPSIDLDPLNRTEGSPYKFFVPVRDAIQDPNNPTVDHTLNVIPGGNFPSFSRRLNEEYFVLYSAGPDGDLDGARRLTQMAEEDKADYLIWPPVMGLLREKLVADGALK
ncbi:MAG: hypothetical protein JNK35_06545 [Phycisphaerae bacterium]|nr:hypothetical protein [Phycisphaerae bacterium]